MRLDAGHRRYNDEQVERVAEVARLRRSGLSMPAAVRRTVEGTNRPTNSFFAAIRGANPALQTHLLGKRALGAITAAMEDECLARAQGPVLMGAFQHARFYRQSQTRWRELNRTVDRTVVFADFGHDHDVAAHPREVALPADSPVLREWALVCDAPGFSACVAGWERPTSPGTADSDRRFETVWTLDPGSVRAATNVGIALLREADSEDADGLVRALTDPAGAASPDLPRATALFSRIVAYTQYALDHGELAS